MGKNFLPDLFLDNIFDIKIDELWEKGIRAIVFDIDNTLAEYGTAIPDEKTAKWLSGLKDKGFAVCLASNNKVERVEKFAKAAEVQYISRAAKPLGVFIKKWCCAVGVECEKTMLVGDQIFTDILGGNRLGMFTILVKPISEEEDSFVKFKRRFERPILRKISKK